MKGIILAGGKATRLYPITKGVCKQLLPVYDKPMIYYPLSTLMFSGIREILIISTPQDIDRFKSLLSDGKDLGLSIDYAIQEEPRGIAESFIIAEDFIAGGNSCLILGDNIFYGHDFPDICKNASGLQDGALVFGYYVNDPGRYAVIGFDKDRNISSIEEKPKNPKTNWAITGLYFYDNKVVEIAKKLKPSARGELEITDINREYLKNRKLKVKLLGRGYAWLDTGTHDSLIDASVFIKTIEERQGLKVGCIEEIAYRMGYINSNRLRELAVKMNTTYGKYLIKVADEKQ